MNKITRDDYMSNGDALEMNDPKRWENHCDYYAQFITPATEAFILSHVGLKKLKTSKDKYFNDIIKHSNGGAGGWIWDRTPFNTTLARELGENLSMSTHTCIGKEAARRLLEA
jgi:hypothetical protein